MKQPRTSSSPFAVIVIIACFVGGFFIITRTLSNLPGPLPQDQVAPDIGFRNHMHHHLFPASRQQVSQASQVIIGQLDAFRADNYVKAEDYQSSDMRRNFGSATVLRQAIRSNYPEFANCAKVSFGNGYTTHEGDVLILPVSLVGRDKNSVSATYIMVKENGNYRVGAVQGGFAGYSNTPFTHRRDTDRTNQQAPDFT